MLWFNNEERRKRMAFIQGYVPTSKANLLQTAMWYHQGDIGKAQEMVDFWMKNMDLPDTDPVPPSLMQQMKEGASDLFGFLKNNQDQILQGYQIIQGIIKNKGALPIVTPEAPGTPLPSINE